MSKRRGWDVRGEERKKSIEAIEDGKERHLSVNTRGGKRKENRSESLTLLFFPF